MLDIVHTHMTQLPLNKVPLIEVISINKGLEKEKSSFFPYYHFQVSYSFLPVYLYSLVFGSVLKSLLTGILDLLSSECFYYLCIFSEDLFFSTEH